MLSTAAVVLAENDHVAGPGWWWPIFPILWLLIFLTVAFLLSLRWRRCGHGANSGIARLSERFAAGDINESEYRARLAVLQEGRR